MKDEPDCTCAHCLADAAMKDLPFTEKERDWIHCLVEANLGVAGVMFDAEEDGVDLDNEKIDAIMDKVFTPPPMSMN